MAKKRLTTIKRSTQPAGASTGANTANTEILSRGKPGSAPAEDDGTAEPIHRLREGQLVSGRHRYELCERLGGGTSGAVWSAACLDTGPDTTDVPPETVAIKFFNAASGRQGTALLRRELAALRSMRSASIPRIYDWAIDNPLSFFVMDYYRHGTLTDELRAPGTFDDKQTWRLLIDLLRALKVAHRAGMLHLDIKPANVMRDGTGGYKLIDFDISQASQILDGPGRTVGTGTRGYRAPEQLRRELDALDTRTDLWAVGATAFALRTGCDLSHHREMFRDGAAGNEPSLMPLSSVCPEAAPELDAFIASLLCEDQETRPGGAAAALERIKTVTGVETPEEPSGDPPRYHTEDEVDAVVANLMDELWSSLCRRPEFRRFFAKFEKGDYLCREGQASHDAFVLLSGKVHTERGGRNLETEDREGTFIGEISTLTGTTRSASVRADGTVWTCMFNAAEFERLLAAHPSIGIRLLKLLAGRLLSYSDNEIRNS